MKKRGQIGIFMIIGLLILILSAFYFYLSNNNSKSNSFSPINSKPSDSDVVKAYAEACIKKIGEDALFNKIGLQGGYINPDGDSKYGENGLTGSPINPPSVLFSGNNVPYYLEAVCDEVYCAQQACVPQPCVCAKQKCRKWSYRENIPDIDAISKKLANYAAVEFEKCFTSDAFKSIGINIIKPNTDFQAVNFDINEEDVSIDFKYPLTIKKDGTETKLDSFRVVLPIRLKDLYDSSRDFAKKIETKIISYQDTDFISMVPYSILDDCNSYDKNGLINVYTKNNADNTITQFNDFSTYYSHYFNSYIFQIAVKNVKVDGNCVGSNTNSVSNPNPAIILNPNGCKNNECNSEPQIPSCSGCIYNNNCYPVGYKDCLSGKECKSPNNFVEAAPCKSEDVPCSGTSAKYFPSDTVCKNEWPLSDGPIIPVKFADYIQNGGKEFPSYGQIYSCAYFEVCSGKIDKYVQEAADCCVNKLNQEQDECKFAQQNSNSNPKRCEGLYLVKNAQQEKYNPYSNSGGACCASSSHTEWQKFCNDITGSQGQWYGNCASPGGLGSGIDSPAKNLIQAMPCKSDPSYSSLDPLQNSCVSTLFAPTSVSMEQMKYRACTVDSSIITTLLRKAGYSSSEVMTVSSAFHYFVLVKFPLDSKYTLLDNYKIDTTNAGSWCNQAWIQCQNDNGLVQCPDKSQVKGCT